MFVIIVLYDFEISSTMHALDDTDFKEVVNINLLWWFVRLMNFFVTLNCLIAYYYQICVR